MFLAFYVVEVLYVMKNFAADKTSHGNDFYLFLKWEDSETNLIHTFMIER